MKCILILLISFVFGQEQDWDLQRGYDYRGLGEETEVDTNNYILVSDEFITGTWSYKADSCFAVALYFEEGFENYFNDSLCAKMVDIRIDHNGIIKDFTFEEFMERLGLKEKQ